MTYYQKLTEFIHSEFPEKAKLLSESDLLERIEQDIQIAREYGFDTEKNGAKFVDLLWRVAPDFYENQAYSWAEGILSNDELGPDQKISLLRDAYAHHCAFKVQGD